MIDVVDQVCDFLIRQDTGCQFPYKEVKGNVRVKYKFLQYCKIISNFCLYFSPTYFHTCKFEIQTDKIVTYEAVTHSRADHA